MKTTDRKKVPSRTLDGWAISLLLEEHAIVECEHHGYMRDKADPHAWERARRHAKDDPLEGHSAAECIAALEEAMRAIGDTCPDCG